MIATTITEVTLTCWLYTVPLPVCTPGGLPPQDLRHCHIADPSPAEPVIFTPGNALRIFRPFPPQTGEGKP